MQRPWLRPGDAGPRLPYARSRASIGRAGPPSRTFGTWGTGGRAEGKLPKVEEEEGGAWPLGSGLRGGRLLASGWSGEQVGGIKGGLAAPRRSQDASQPGWACCESQMAASGLCTLPGTECVQVGSQAVPASVPGSSPLAGEEGELEGEPGAGAPADLLVLPAPSILAPQGLLREQGQLPAHPFLLCGGPGSREDGDLRGIKYRIRLDSEADQLVHRGCVCLSSCQHLFKIRPYETAFFF